MTFSTYRPADHILFEDGEALVIDKPAGLPVTAPRRGGPSLEDHLPDLRLGFAMAPVPVHRLDQDTSGCLLLARNRKALARFGEAFVTRQVDKHYLGVLDGVPTGRSGTIGLALAKTSSAARGWRMVADPEGAAAITHWQLLGTAGGRSLVGFRPETGRTHQIRIHALAGLGHPLLGDPVYGSGDGAARTLLHAVRIAMARQGKPPIRACAPLPPDFAAAGFGDVAPWPDAD